MDRNPETAAPQGPLVRGATGDPEINLPLKTRLVTLQLVGRAADCDCAVWVGLAVPGTATPAMLLNVPDIPALLTAAATEGVVDQGPLMLSDAGVEPPRAVFLLPVPSDDFREQASWIHHLVTSLHSLAPAAVGIYIAPEAMATGRGLDLLLAVLREAIQCSAASTFHLLTGAHGINSVLNTALKLKSELESDRLSLFVYH